MDSKLTTYKTVLYGTATGAIALVALSALWYASSYAHSFRPESGWNTISVTAEGKATGVPDIAQISFSVSTDGGKDVSAAQESTNKKMDDITKFLVDQGVGKDDITTTGYNVNPRYNYPVCTGGICRSPEVTGYTVMQSVSVKVRDVSKSGAIVSGVVSKGATGVSGPTFVIDDATKLQDEARGKAIAKAKAKAETIAKQSGIKLGKLLSITDDTQNPMPYGMGGDAMYESQKGGGMMAPAAATAPNIQPGSQDVTINVTLNYSIR